MKPPYACCASPAPADAATAGSNVKLPQIPRPSNLEIEEVGGLLLKSSLEEIDGVDGFRSLPAPASCTALPCTRAEEKSRQTHARHSRVRCADRRQKRALLKSPTKEPY